jgi:hypothetical protein
MRGTANLDAEQKYAVAEPAANAAAVVTLTPVDANELFVVDHIAFSYSGTPTAGRLTVEIGGVVICKLDITTGGPGPIDWQRGLCGKPGETIVITLAAGGSGIAGLLNVSYH